MLRTYDSISAFVDACPKPGTKGPRGWATDRGSSSWTAGLDFDAAMSLARLGDETYVKDANKLLDKLDVALPETLGPVTVRSPYGSRFDMSDWLNGSPTPMRRRVKRNLDVAPVKIVASITCSAAISSETIAKRGAAILAFLMQVQRIRPVELYVLLELHGQTNGWNYSLIKVESKPLNVSQACFVLCSSAFLRHSFTIGDVDGWNSGWPTGYHNSDYATVRRERLSLGPQDIVIKEAHMSDQLLSDPETWIKTELAKINATTGTGE